ncbi:MAG: dihydropteroate synthase [Selenomonadaceae bacterium]|nr:dihydropteroate synthase [Selenomonadaceae bacterium]
MNFDKKTLIMGILNVTPDSFSDGGNFYEVDAAINHAEKLVANGADIIDIGAESTRPNFTPITADEEILRLEKIIPKIKNFGVPVSVDTYKPKVAEIALELGAEIINDISGLADDEMIHVAKKFNAPVIAMHNRKFEGNVIDDIKNFFRQTLKRCENFGLNTQIIFDAGIGFNKTQEENLTVLRNLRELKILDGKNIPLLLGVSRKSVIGYATGFEIDNRDEATGAICVLAISQGVNILRVHNVKMISKMRTMADAIIN